MNPYAELGLISEASLTSSSLCPEAAEAAEGVIDRRRPAGSVGRIEEMLSGKTCASVWHGTMGVKAQKGNGSAVLCLNSFEATQSKLEPGEQCRHS